VIALACDLQHQFQGLGADRSSTIEELEVIVHGNNHRSRSSKARDPGMSMLHVLLAEAVSTDSAVPLKNVPLTLFQGSINVRVAITKCKQYAIWVTVHLPVLFACMYACMAGSCHTKAI
jgi:hypothetical protein